MAHGRLCRPRACPGQALGQGGKTTQHHFLPVRRPPLGSSWQCRSSIFENADPRPLGQGGRPVQQYVRDYFDLCCQPGHDPDRPLRAYASVHLPHSPDRQPVQSGELSGAAAQGRLQDRFHRQVRCQRAAAGSGGDVRLLSADRPRAFFQKTTGRLTPSRERVGRRPGDRVHRPTQGQRPVLSLREL